MYPLCTNYVQCLQYLQVLKYSSTYKYLVKYLSISTSTLGKSRKYLSKVQVLSNVYLSIRTHVLGPMSGTLVTSYFHSINYDLFLAFVTQILLRYASLRDAMHMST